MLLDPDRPIADWAAAVHKVWNAGDGNYPGALLRNQDFVEFYFVGAGPWKAFGHNTGSADKTHTARTHWPKP
jgi:hypothetical protein